MKNISKGKYVALTIPLPTLPEQQAIASALSDTDDLIGALEALIAKKQAIKQGAMQELLTGRKRLPEFTGEWEEKRLGDACTLINGRAYSLHEWRTSGVPVIRLQNLTGGSEYYFSDLQLPEKQYCDSGDLLYMWSATFGPRIWQGTKAIFHYHIWKVAPLESIASKTFLFYVFASITDDLKKHSSSGGTMLHVTKESMENTVVSLPQLSEQQAIASILSDMDSEIAQLEDQLSKTRALKQGMMQELLTGRIRLV